jgi:hypothetical protein
VELLFDDRRIDRRAGVRRVLGRPQKEPAPLLEAEAPWEASGCAALHALFYDPEARRFKLWYRATGPADEGGFLCYAESEDGLRWTRPDLGRFVFDGSRRNNILRALRDGDTMFYNLVKDPLDPDPRRRYKAIGFDYAGTSAVAGVEPGGRAVCVGYSEDGLDWPDPPRAVMGTADLTDADCLLPYRDPAGRRWVGFFRPRTHPKRRFVGYAESTDFERWTYPQMLFAPDAYDDEWTEFYGLIVATAGEWRVGSLWVFHNNPAASPMTQELVYSRDGRDYRRAAPGTELVPLGPTGAFDSRMISTVAFFEHHGEFRLYYNGTNREHGSDRGQPMAPGRVAPGEARRAGLGLARLPWGHFCGLRADLDGLVESAWLCNYGTAGVQLVGAIDEGGWIRAELLDQFGGVIPGWGRESSRVWEAGGGRLGCAWGDPAEGAGGRAPEHPARLALTGRCGQTSAAGGVVGHVVKLRFHLHRATLFGFQVGDEGTSPPPA